MSRGSRDAPGGLDAVSAKRHDVRMTDERNIRAIEELLAETEAAHGAYETAELNGAYDEQWPAWYADYAVDHGMGGLLGREVTADELGQQLQSAWADFQAADPHPEEGWVVFIARRLAAGG